MIEQRAGVIDPYNPQVHTEAARLIEYRLGTLDPEIVEERRGRLRVVPYAGIDWVFVRVDDFPIEKDPLGNTRRTIAQAYYESKRGTFTHAAGTILITDAQGGHYIACTPDQQPKEEDEIVPTNLAALDSRGFTTDPVGPILFTSSDGDAVKMALLNTIAPKLGKDYFPGELEAADYKFFHEGRDIFDQDVVATYYPQTEDAKEVEFPPAPRRYSFQ